MEPRDELASICRRYGLLAVYLFGSRAGDGMRLLAGEEARAGSSDLDVGLLFEGGGVDDVGRLAALQIAFEDLFAPLAVDLVPLDRVDPIFQFRIIDGERVHARDPRRADLFELEVMRSASELLAVQRQIERQRYGVSTT